MFSRPDWKKPWAVWSDLMADPALSRRLDWRPPQGPSHLKYPSISWIKQNKIHLDPLEEAYWTSAINTNLVHQNMLRQEIQKQELPADQILGRKPQHMFRCDFSFSSPLPSLRKTLNDVNSVLACNNSNFDIKCKLRCNFFPLGYNICVNSRTRTSQ